MSTWHVDAVRKQPAPSGGHDHVIAVRVLGGNTLSIDEVLSAMFSDKFYTSAGAEIIADGVCESGCAGNYIRTREEQWSGKTLDTLPTF